VCLWLLFVCSCGAGLFEIEADSIKAPDSMAGLDLGGFIPFQPDSIESKSLRKILIMFKIVTQSSELIVDPAKMVVYGSRVRSSHCSFIEDVYPWSLSPSNWAVLVVKLT
jgi:hypothetical protein